MTVNELLSGKKILFLSVQTFNLEKEMKKVMEKNGASVTYYDERPSNSNFTKGIIRLSREVYKKRIDAYYDRILEQTREMDFDYLFVNRGEVVTAKFLRDFISRQPRCIRIFFTWDSFSNHKHPVTILNYFQKRFTFDLQDAEKYKIGFRPLFFLDHFKEIKGKNTGPFRYDLLFLGTAHSDRYHISTEVLKWCINHGLNGYTFYYIHSKAVYLYKKTFDKTFKEFDYNKLSFKSLTTDQIVDLYRQSDVILDINHPGQKGLTMRTFEAIGAGKKLITTNSEVSHYPFYHPDSFFIIDRNNPVPSLSFFQSAYVAADKELYERCSLQGWLSDIFLKEETDDWKKLMN